MRGDDYKFLRIEDAISCVNQEVNLIGVVVEVSVPKFTRGSDAFCSVKIIDESRPSGMHINFFAPMDGLPQVENTGDIILVCRVTVKTRTGESYALFQKKSSYFALFEGRETDTKNLWSYQFSSRYKPRDHDMKFIRRLREWSIEQKHNFSNESLSLKDIKEAENLNLLCKILCDVKGDQLMLFVWDGTDAPPAPLVAKIEDEMENPLPLQLSLLPRDILCTFPSVGTVLRMYVDQGNTHLGLHYFKPNRWVKLTNVKCEVRAALWVAMLMPYSKISYLHDDDEAVIQLLRSYNERFSSKWGRMPLTSFPWPSKVTETGHPNVPIVTLMDILTYPEATFKFKCVVRVAAIIPWRAEDFRSPSGIYRMRLTLEDPTARLHALLYAEDGVNFFGNFASLDVLTKKRDTLLGVGPDGTRNPPWIQCCLKSYYIDESDIWGSRNYRIFDTTCLG